MNYEEWLAGVPKSITNDPLWRNEVYRLALFLGDLAWHDVSKLVKDRRTRSLADQLYRASGSISANICEGYSRASRKDQARFYEYALGSARESRDWYFKARNVLGATVFKHRVKLLVQIIRQLLTMVPTYRNRRIEEDPVTYEFEPVDQLLNTVPLPNE